MSTGVVATASFASAYYTDGAGALTLYPVVAFDDRSVLRLKSVGADLVND